MKYSTEHKLHGVEMLQATRRWRFQRVATDAWQGLRTRSVT